MLSGNLRLAEKECGSHPGCGVRFREVLQLKGQGEMPMRPHPIFAALLGAAAIALSSPMPATAQQVPPSALTAQQFLANPDALLSQYPDGGDPMIAEVRNLAANDPATLNALIALLSKANEAQAKAIGTALGDVAKSDAGTNPDYAAQIQVAVVVANSNPALAAFNAVIGGDIQLTAVTGGVGGGGGGGQTNQTGGGGTTIFSSPFTLTTATNNIPDSFTNNFSNISNSVSK
jgi:hypothetical protein